MSKDRSWHRRAPRRGMFTGYTVDGPRPGRDTPILWPPRLPWWWQEAERRIASGWVLHDAGPMFFCKREEFRLELYGSQDGKCHWCDKPMSLERKRTTATGRVKDNGTFATFEHLKPRHLGGGFSRTNIVLAHGTCNAKRDRRRYPNDPHPYGPANAKHLRSNMGESFSSVGYCGTEKQV